MKERWRDVIGYEGLYQVSDHGRVKSLPRGIPDGNQYKSSYIRNISGRMLKQANVNKSGHKTVGLSCDGTATMFLVHRLVFAAFVGKPPKVINHIDNDPTNNNLSNIEASSSVHNARHAIDNGYWLDKGSDNPNSKVTEDEVIIMRLLREAGYTLKYLAWFFEISYTNTYMICTHKTWTHV